MCKLDWVSFTFPMPLVGEKDDEYTLGQVLMAFHDHTAHRFLGVVTNALWQWKPVAGFYTHRIQCPSTLLTVSWKGGNPYALVEISGQAVDLVLKSISASDLAKATGERCTRVDFAVDIETGVQPSEFTFYRHEEAFKSTSFIKSETGETVYIGSRKSERMARVYRYYLPHPRANLLRVEAEYKGDAAKEACKAIVERSLTEVTLSAHLPFGWHHPVWDVGDVEVSKIAARKYDDEGANTLRWLMLTVAPAIKKAHQEGLISLDEFIDEHLRK